MFSSGGKLQAHTDPLGLDRKFSRVFALMRSLQKHLRVQRLCWIALKVSLFFSNKLMLFALSLII